MIEFFKLKNDPNIVVMREKGARGPTKETRIVLGSPVITTENLEKHWATNGPTIVRVVRRKRKNARRK